MTVEREKLYVTAKLMMSLDNVLKHFYLESMAIKKSLCQKQRLFVLKLINPDDEADGPYDEL